MYITNTKTLKSKNKTFGTPKIYQNLKVILVYKILKLKLKLKFYTRTAPDREDNSATKCCFAVVSCIGKILTLCSTDLTILSSP